MLFFIFISFIATFISSFPLIFQVSNCLFFLSLFIFLLFSSFFQKLYFLNSFIFPFFSKHCFFFGIQPSALLILDTWVFSPNTLPFPPQSWRFQTTPTFFTPWTRQPTTTSSWRSAASPEWVAPNTWPAPRCPAWSRKAWGSLRASSENSNSHHPTGLVRTSLRSKVKP